MVGIVIVAHFDLAEKFLEIAEKILKRKPKNIITVSVDLSKDPNELKPEINKAIKKVDEKEGVLILTDMFGGTPCNISLAFLKEGAVEVLTGVNLPMVIEVLDLQTQGKTLSDLAYYIQNVGQKNICLASEILNRKSSSRKED